MTEILPRGCSTAQASKLVEALRSQIKAHGLLCAALGLDEQAHQDGTAQAREALSSFTAETSVDADGRDGEQSRHLIERWNIEWDGSDLLICFNSHEKGEDCEYVRFVPSSKARSAGPQDTTAHTVEREKGFREGIEAAAKVAADFPSATHIGEWTRDQITARIIRSLSSERPADIADRSDSASMGGGHD